jgi:tRNA(Leu) C34 or U34 (ribose-2'-O)-methylase TrmL
MRTRELTQLKSFILELPEEPALPAVALVNPKFPVNVAGAVRAAACFGVRQVWYSGERVRFSRAHRLPRELRCYKEVKLTQHNRFFDTYRDLGVVPVAVEVLENAQCLTEFEHPENALYVFGPEDGTLARKHLLHCHRFVRIPTLHCANLAASVYMTLYDRKMKSFQKGREQ